METDKFYLKNIKQLLIKEINAYYDIYKLKKSKNNIIEELKRIIELFNSEKYNMLYYNFKNYEDFLKKIYPNINIKQLNNIYFYLSGIVNNYELKEDKDKYNFAISNINSFNDDLKNLLSQLQKEYDSIDMDISYQDVTDYQMILANIKNSSPINHYGYEAIKKLLSSKGYSEKEIIILLERVRIYNNRIKVIEKGIKYNPLEAYKLLNILDYGFEQIVIDDNYKSDKCDNLINSVKQVLKHTQDLKEILPAFNGENMFTYGFTIDEFKYVINSLLLYYQNEIYKNYKDLTNLTYYDDIEFRNEFINSYYECLAKYLIVRNYYDSEMQKYNDYLQSKYSENNNNDNDDEIELYYSIKNNDKDTTYFEDDLKSISYDVYDNIKALIIKFKKNNLSNNEIKSLNEVYHGLRELRDDQIRILFRHLSDNKYVIIGVFIKQSDNDRTEYRKMYFRQYSNIKNYKECEQNIFEIMDKKRRDGGRKK